MIALKDLLDMVCTEASEGDVDSEVSVQLPEPADKVALIFDLQLIEEPDGTLRWIEG